MENKYSAADPHTPSTDTQAEIAALVSEISRIRILALKTYTRLVDKVAVGIITDEKEIERIMDGLADFGDFPECLNEYRRLCRLVYYKYPKLVGEHINLFRMLCTPDEEPQK